MEVGGWRSEVWRLKNVGGSHLDLEIRMEED